MTQAPGKTMSDGFFHHHGIWAPGVRAFRRMQFKAKAGLITLAFLLPLVLLGIINLEARLKIIRDTGEERDGVAYAREVIAVISAASDLRHHTLRELSQQPANVGEARTQLAGKLARLAELDKAMGARLGTREPLAKVQEAAANQPPSSEGTMKVYAANARLLDALYGLLDVAADSSGLSLDPDLDTYQLMVAGIVELPRFVGLHTRMGDLAATVAITGQGGEIAAVELARLDAIAGSRSETVVHALRKVIGEHPHLKAALDFEPMARQLVGYRELATEEPGKGGLQKAEKLSTVRQATAGTLRDMRQRILVELDRLLQARIDTAYRHIATVGTAIGLSLLVAGYLFTSFFLVMHGGLAKMRRHLDLMTHGDLTDSPEPWGADEAADLMLALKAAQESMRQIVCKVRAAAEQIAAASGQIAQGAQDMSTRTEQAASSLQQTSSSMQEIASEVNRTADVTGDAARLAVDNANVAGEGGTIIGHMVTTMDAINESSHRITDILGVIDGIAFQTNILALNAAVEAARAGDQGRGFAVVAGEVRALARRSSESAKEIKTLIGSSVEKVEAGAQVVRRAGQTMQRIVDNAQRIQGMLEGIARGAQAQGNSLGQVGGAVHQVDDATQQNAALSEQTAAAAHSLSDQARSLVAEVARFKLPG